MRLDVISCGPEVYMHEPQRPSPAFLSPEEENDCRQKSVKAMQVIVVDDEPVIADSLADILEGEGCRAMAVSGGAAAVELARELRPHVVITDVSMPGMNGIETAIAIRQICPDCRIILFSGHGSTADLLEEARAQGHDFELLPKPVRPEALLKLLGLWKPKQ
jgi:CheY-like chemotaxis protein